MQMKDDEFYYDIYKFEISMIATRSNFLLVFQSMLFAAIATLSDKNTWIPIGVILLFGLISSIIWLYLNCLTYVVTKKIYSKLTITEKRIPPLIAVRQKYILLKNGSVTFLMAVILPTSTIAVWGTLLIYKYALCFFN